jgi:hypothetical protein
MNGVKSRRRRYGDFGRRLLDARQLAAPQHRGQGEGSHFAERGLVVACAKIAEREPLGGQGRHVAQDRGNFFQLGVRLFARRGQPDDHPGPQTLAERHGNAPADVAFNGVRRQVVEKRWQGQVKGNANDVHATSDACGSMLDKILAKAFNPLLHIRNLLTHKFCG